MAELVARYCTPRRHQFTEQALLPQEGTHDASCLHLACTQGPHFKTAWSDIECAMLRRTCIVGELDELVLMSWHPSKQYEELTRPCALAVE